MDGRTDGLGNAGPRPTIEFEGRTYAFGMLTEGVMAAVGTAVWKRDGEPLYDSREHMDKDEYQKRLDEHIKAKRDGLYLFENDRCQEFLETTEGCILLASLLMGVDAAAVMRMMQTIPGELIRVLNDVANTSAKIQGTIEAAVGPKAQARSLLTKNLARKGGKVKGGKAGRKGRR